MFTTPVFANTNNIDCAVDFEHGSLFVSKDGATTFAATASSGLLANMHDDHPRSAEQPWPLPATPGREGDLWFVSKTSLFHSDNGGRIFTTVRSDLPVDALASARRHPSRITPHYSQ